MTASEVNDTAVDVELLSFRIGEQEYCVDIMSVREIRGWTKATPLPYSPAHVKGVINLRGTVLPVVDLSARLGMDPLEGEERNVIIVVNLNGHMAGLLVDAVSDILTIPRSEMQTPPDVGGDASVKCIEGLLLVEGRLIRVLDLRAVLPHEHSDAA